MPSNETITLYSPDGKQPQAVLFITDIEPYHASFDLHEVVCWNMDNTIADDGPNGSGTESVWRGSLKWDGCCNSQLGDEEGSLHFDGEDGLERLTNKVKWAYAEVAKRIEKWHSK